MSPTLPLGNKIAGICGIIFALLSAAIFPAIFPNFPPPLGGAADDIVAFHQTQGLAFMIANYLGVLAMIPGLIKLSYLVKVFRLAEKQDDWLSLFVLSSGIFAFAIGTCDLIFFQTLSFLAEPELKVGAKALSDLASAGFALFLVGQLAHAMAIVWATIATRALPKWVAISGCFVMVFSFVGSLGANLSQPAFLAGGGDMSGIALGVFLGWYAALDFYFLRKQTAIPISKKVKM